MPIRSRRLARCAGCALPDALCLCAELVPIALRTRVVIVAHHKELWKSSGTARLAARMLEGAELHARGAGEVRAPIEGAGRRLALFPSEDSRPLRPDDADEPAILIVPDGSWSQAGKAVRRDPLAQDAERVALPAVHESRYGLRRAGREGGLCTLEAIARALAILEGPVAGPAIESRLLAALDAFVARQSAIRRGTEAPR